MVTVYYFTNIAPHYRSSLWSILLNNSNWEMHIFYSDDFNSGIKMIDLSKEEFATKQDRFHKLKCFQWKGKKEIWQKGVIKKCFKSDFQHAVFLGEISRISTWISVLICRLRGIHVTFWGHGLYGNESRVRLMIKKMLFSMAHTHLLYERRAKELMIKQGFSHDKLYVFFNSLDYETHNSLYNRLIAIDKNDVFPFFENKTLPVIIFIGRLTPVKKLDLLLEAVDYINKDSPKFNLMIIGDGPEKKELELKGLNGINSKWLHFTGACYDEEEIGRYLSKSDLCVSPGNVGLTAVHSLSFGTPVCTHDNMSNQMPEAGAIQDGYNGFFFKENDSEDLKKKIMDWFSNNYDRNLVRDRSIEIIHKYYNPHYQQSVFERIINGEKPEL